MSQSDDHLLLRLDYGFDIILSECFTIIYIYNLIQNTRYEP